MDTLSPACTSARGRIIQLRQPLQRGTDTLKQCFFPVDEICRDFPRDEVEKILECGCQKCRGDRKFVKVPTNPHDYAKKIVTQIPAMRLFALMVFISHPTMIFEFLQKYHSPSEDPSDYRTEDLESKYLASADPLQAPAMIIEFQTYKHQFFVPKLEKIYHEFGAGTMLPFLDQEKIGKKNEHGEIKSEGMYGTVYKLRIPRCYTTDLFNEDEEPIEEFARKELHTANINEFWIEADNLNRLSALSNQEHVVRLFKPYKLDDKYNLLFPYAKGNLDDFLRDPQNDMFRGTPVEKNPLWKQMLGITEALARLHQGVEESTVDGNKAQLNAYHFDLKPANILISKSDMWEIADFGQASFKDRTRSRGTSSRLIEHGGTESYAPPEIEKDGAQPTAYYDVWSMGCIMLEVTTFIIMGSLGVKALDQARYTKPAGSNGWDHRLWQKNTDGAFILKPAIEEFMQGLANEVRLGRSRQFVEGILKNIISPMLSPDENARVPAKDVARRLSIRCLQHEQRQGSIAQPHLIGKDEGQSKRQKELGTMMLWHYKSKLSRHDDPDTVGATIHLFQQGARTDKLRLVLVLDEPGQPMQIHHFKDLITLSDVAFVPVYAFKPRFDSFRSGLHFYLSSNHGSLVLEGLQFAVSPSGTRLPVAMLAQSAFTGQEVLEAQSFNLTAFHPKERVNLWEKLKASKKTKSSDNHASPSTREEHGSTETITAQIWKEPGRTQDRPRIVRVAVFRRDRTIFLMRLRKEIVLNMKTTQGQHNKQTLRFESQDPSKVPSIHASILKVPKRQLSVDEEEIHYAGIPLDAKVLGDLESSSEKCYDFIDLTFNEAKDAELFKDIFLGQMKRERQERRAMESSKLYAKTQYM